MKIIIFHAVAGHGHKKAAEYLTEEFQKRKETHPDLEITNIDFLKFTPRHFQKSYPWSYEFMVSKIPWFWKGAYWFLHYQPIARLLCPLRRLFNKIHSTKLEEFLIKENPDVLLFTHFFPPEVATSLKRKGKIHSKLISVVTDFFPHSTWINRGTDYFVVMTDIAEEELVRWGIDESGIKQFGIPTGKQFAFKDNQRGEREKLGIDPDKFTVLLTSGSFGIGPLEELIENIKPYGEKVQVLVVCGNNQSLFDRLSAKANDIPGKVYGFVDNMDELMEASNLIVAKTGGLTTCESLAKMLPMVISSPIPGQEAMNAEYLLKKNCAFSIKNPEDIRGILDQIFVKPDDLHVVSNSSILEEKKENIKKVRRPKAAEDIVDFVLSL